MTFWMTSQYMKQMRKELRELGLAQLSLPPHPGWSQPPRGSEDPRLFPSGWSSLLCALSRERRPGDVEGDPARGSVPCVFSAVELARQGAGRESQSQG